ncbi:hypothetical protein [Vibrio tritonius]|uniref:hypothetical protein n=1 Tax=Vibrio tritonius TaxID=1435069 RepID=UPI000838B1BE
MLAVLLFISWRVVAAQDPTEPLSWMNPSQEKKVVRQPLPTLNSIICSSGCSAIINGEIVSQNDVINGYKIKSISVSSVVLVRDKQEWTLDLYSQDIKQ